MAAAIAVSERVCLWQEELQRIVGEARLLRPEARRAIGSVLRSLLREACGDREEITALRTVIELFDTPRATTSKAAFGVDVGKLLRNRRTRGPFTSSCSEKFDSIAAKFNK